MTLLLGAAVAVALGMPSVDTDDVKPKKNTAYTFMIAGFG